MTKKDFTNVTANKVYSAIQIATEEPAQKTQEVQEVPETESAHSEQKTQEKHDAQNVPRMNFAFTPDNYDYVRIMSKITGKSMTRFINDVIARDAERNAELFEQAKAIRDNL